MLSAMMGKKKKQRPCPPLKVILSHPPDDESCQAVAIHGCFDRAAFCSAGRSERWFPLGAGQGLDRSQPQHCYHDFVYWASRKAFMNVNRSAGGEEKHLEFWGGSLKVPVKTVEGPLVWMWRFRPPPPGQTWFTYLVPEEESGRLYMVRRFKISDTLVKYSVYLSHKIRYTEFSLECDSLDGVVMFVGINHSFAVRAARVPQYKPNYIYFSGVWFNHANNYVDIYDYNTKAYTQLFGDFSPDQEWPFHSTLPWSTLSQT